MKASLVTRILHVLVLIPALTACAGNDWKVYVGKGDEAAAEGNMEKAHMYYEKALSMEPDEAEFYCFMGDTYLRTKDMEPAIACYEKAVKLTEDENILIRAYFNMGTAYSLTGLSYDLRTNTMVSAGRPKQIECYKKAAKLGSESAQQWLSENGERW